LPSSGCHWWLCYSRHQRRSRRCADAMPMPLKYIPCLAPHPLSPLSAHRSWLSPLTPHYTLHIPPSIQSTHTLNPRRFCLCSVHGTKTNDESRGTSKKRMADWLALVLVLAALPLSLPLLLSLSLPLPLPLLISFYYIPTLNVCTVSAIRCMPGYVCLYVYLYVCV